MLDETRTTKRDNRLPIPVPASQQFGLSSARLRCRTELTFLVPWTLSLSVPVPFLFLFLFLPQTAPHESSWEINFTLPGFPALAGSNQTDGTRPIDCNLDDSHLPNYDLPGRIPMQSQEHPLLYPLPFAQLSSPRTLPLFLLFLFLSLAHSVDPEEFHQ
jgi:hypothetical protein